MRLKSPIDLPVVLPAALLVALLGLAPIPAADAAPAGALLVRCGALIDGIRDEALPATDVLIVDGRFARISPAADRADLDGMDVEVDVHVLDLSEHTCLPGLVEMHTHIMEGPEDLTDLTQVFDDTHAETMANGRRFARLTLESGVTTARDLGSYYGWAARDLRDEINRGETPGPRLLVAGYYLTIPGGGGDLLAPNIRESDIPRHMRLGVARSPDDFALRAQAAVDGGADVVKVIASGAVLAYGGVPGSPEMSPPDLRAAIEVAHAAGLKVAAHAHGAQSIIEAIEAGADTIEHATYIDEEGIRLAIEHDVALSMDIGAGDWMIEEGRKQGWVPEFLDKTIATTQIQRDSFRRAHAAGVPIVFGTDAGIYPHGMAGIQFKFMVEYGMTPMEAIQAATSVAARYLGWEDRIGAIEVGHYGDLIAVRGNPLKNVRLLEHVDAVVKDGVVFKAPEPAGAGGAPGDLSRRPAVVR